MYLGDGSVKSDSGVSSSGTDESKPGGGDPSATKEPNLLTREKRVTRSAARTAQQKQKPHKDGKDTSEGTLRIGEVGNK